MVQYQKARVIEAYRNNVALPELSIADHRVIKPIDAVGEDGQAMTWERRVALAQGRPVGTKMTGAGIDLRDDVDFRVVRDNDLTPESYGASADARKPQIRVVRPQGFTVAAEIDIGVPSDLEPATFARMPCCWSTGQDLVGNRDELQKYCFQAVEAIKALCQGLPPTEVHTAKATMFALEGLTTRQPMLPPEGVQFLGFPVKYTESLRNELRFYANNQCGGVPRIYASVFVHRDLVTMYSMAIEVDDPKDPQCPKQ